MPDAEKCSSCGAEVEAGAPSCAACGKLTAAPVKNTTPVIVGCLGGFALGLALGSAILFADIQGTAQIGAAPGSRVFVFVIVILVAVAFPIGVFLVGLAAAVRGKPAVGAFLMTGAEIGLALPSPCTIVFIMLAAAPIPALAPRYTPGPSWTPQPFTPVTAPPTSSVATFGPARSPRPVYIPAPH